MQPLALAGAPAPGLIGLLCEPNFLSTVSPRLHVPTGQGVRSCSLRHLPSLASWSLHPRQL